MVEPRELRGDRREEEEARGEEETPMTSKFRLLDQSGDTDLAKSAAQGEG